MVSFHMLLMSGLMGVWSWMAYLALVLLGVAFMPMHLAAAWFGRQWRHLEFDCIVLFMVLCRLCSGLRFGEF